MAKQHKQKSKGERVEPKLRVVDAENPTPETPNIPANEVQAEAQPQAEAQATAGAQAPTDAPPKVKRKQSPTRALQKAVGDINIKATVHKLVEGNPKQEGCAAASRFELYEEGMTVEQYIAKSFEKGTPKSLIRADLRWDIAKKFIELVPPPEAPAPVTEAQAQAPATIEAPTTQPTS